MTQNAISNHTSHTKKFSPKLQEEISKIEGQHREKCIALWQESFGRSPPKHLSPQFLKRVLIWELQNQKLGRVSVKTERDFLKISSGKMPLTKAKAGSQLIREWNGRTFQVDVVDGGYVMDGKTWKSLSAIAKHITGAHWSGPRFFGVK